MQPWLERLHSGQSSLQEIQQEFFQEDKEPSQERMQKSRTAYLAFLESASPEELQKQVTKLNEVKQLPMPGYENSYPSMIQWWYAVLKEKIESALEKVLK